MPPRTPPPLPTVSVVVPTYNEEKLIARTLSTLRRVMPSGQIIVADGHSKDKTASIARKYARVVMEREHSVGGGRNAGAEKATGDILWFVDADTFPTKEFYDEMRKQFTDPHVVGVGCQIMPEHISFLRTIFFRFLNFIVYAGVIAGRPSIAGSCVAYRRKTFETINGFDTQTHSAEDFELCNRIAHKGKVVFLPHVTVPTSNRRVKQLGVWGLVKDWTHATVMFLAGKKTTSYFAPR